ncbi:MAG: hypothetical protein CJBNEKGG_00199 [Prosthecobacter sp.]|nr:hypothetical protein [Prosthecobacter sp.]
MAIKDHVPQRGGEHGYILRRPDTMSPSSNVLKPASAASHFALLPGRQSIVPAMLLQG